MSEIKSTSKYERQIKKIRRANKSIRINKKLNRKINHFIKKNNINKNFHSQVKLLNSYQINKQINKMILIQNSILIIVSNFNITFINIIDFNFQIIKNQKIDFPINNIIELKDGKIVFNIKNSLIIHSSIFTLINNFNNPIQIINYHITFINNIIEFKNGNLASSSNDGIINIWKNDSNNFKLIFSVNNICVRFDKIFSLSNTKMILTNENYLFFFSLNDRKITKIIQCFNYINSMKLINDNLILGYSKKIIYFIDIQNEQIKLFLDLGFNIINYTFIGNYLFIIKDKCNEIYQYLYKNDDNLKFINKILINEMKYIDFIIVNYKVILFGSKSSGIIQIYK